MAKKSSGKKSVSKKAKASKKAGAKKTPSSKKGAVKKARSTKSKLARKKAPAKKTASKRPAPKKAAAKKAGAKKAGAKKAAAKKGGARKATVRALAEALQPCMSLGVAGDIVADCIPGGIESFNDTLQEAGLITQDQRDVFRQCVFNEVINHDDCDIDQFDIPNSADSVLMDIRSAVKDRSHKKS